MRDMRYGVLTVQRAKSNKQEQNNNNSGINSGDIESNTSYMQMQREENSETIYIGNLPSNISQEELRNFLEAHLRFEKLGKITVHYPRLHKGFAFLFFENREARNKVLDKPPDIVIKGLTLSFQLPVAAAKFEQKNLNKEEHNNADEDEEEQSIDEIIMNKEENENHLDNNREQNRRFFVSAK